VLHDDVHRSDDMLRPFSTFVGVVLGVSTYTYKKAHIAHHSFLGEREKDPQYVMLDDIEAHEHDYLLEDELQIKHSAPMRIFMLIMQEIGSIAMKRDGYIIRSLFDKNARAELYDKLSFTGVARPNLSASLFSLTHDEIKAQRKIDIARLIYQTLLIIGLFFSSIYMISLIAILGSSIAALFNSYRASLEHTFAENDSNNFHFNRHNSSNTGGNDLFHKIVWYPVPYHALHHVTPWMPFFLLKTLQGRITNSEVELVLEKV